jgi:hypothetical protein
MSAVAALFMMLRLRHPQFRFALCQADIGVMQLEPAGDNSLNEQPLQRGRFWSGQLRSHQFHLPEGGFAEGEILPGGGVEEGAFGLTGEVASEHVHNGGVLEPLTQFRQSSLIALLSAANEIEKRLPIIRIHHSCRFRRIGHRGTSSVRVQ